MRILLNKYLCSHKILVHAMPMVLLTFVAIVYSCGTSLFYPCPEMFDYGIQLCGGPCFQLRQGIGTFDLVFTILLPLSCIIFFNCLLIVRVIQQKRRMAQKNVWTKNLGMLVQLLTISILHTIVWMPIVVVTLIVLASKTSSDFILQLQESWVLINIIYLAVLGNPIVCIFAIPEIREKVAYMKDKIKGRLGTNSINQTHPSTGHAVITNRLPKEQKLVINL